MYITHNICTQTQTVLTFESHPTSEAEVLRLELERGGFKGAMSMKHIAGRDTMRTWGKGARKDKDRLIIRNEHWKEDR